jgi:tetratricopeptide (TPR) repeat protein
MDSSDERLQEGIAAYKQGQKQQARRSIKQALRLNPKNENAWLWLSGVVESDEQRRTCLDRALAINPNNKAARRGLALLTAEPPPEKRPSPQPEPPLPAIPSPPPIPLERSNKLAAPQPAKSKKRRSRAKVFFGLLVLLLIVGFLSLAIVSPTLLASIGINAFNQPPSQPQPQPRPQPFTPEEASAVLNTVYENIAASNVENIDRYMASIHTPSNDYQTTREILEALYRDYDLTATISGIELVNYSAEEAQVSFVLETRKRNGPEFRDNVIRGIFILRPENGQWKLYDQVVNNIDYFDPTSYP